MLSKYLILCCPFLFLSSIFSNIRVFSNKSALCIRWPKYWSFSINPSNEYSGLISLPSKELSRVFSSTTIRKHQLFDAQSYYGPTLISVHDYWKRHSFDYSTFLPLNLRNLLQKANKHLPFPSTCRAPFLPLLVPGAGKSRQLADF